MHRYLLLLVFLLVPLGVGQAEQFLYYPFASSYDPPSQYINSYGCPDACHTGTDYGCPYNTPIYAAISGTVTQLVDNQADGTEAPGCDFDEGYGNYITIESGNRKVRYAHCKKYGFVVSQNDVVIAGQLIGYTSNSGYTCGSGPNGSYYHLHFEIWLYESGQWSYKDPYSYQNGLWITPYVYGGQTFLATQTGYHIEPDGPYTPGQTIECWVYWRNDGSATWSNQSGAAYVELGSCNSSGTIVTSYLYASGLGWLNDKVPCTMSQSTVAPGQTATFHFYGKIPASAQPGQVPIYFGPVYNGQIMDYWNGNGFTIQVDHLSSSNDFEAFAGDFNGDGYCDVGLWEHTAGKWYIALRNPSSQQFVFNDDPWLTGWGTQENYHLVVGDFNNDGYDDVCLHRTTNGYWYVALSTGNSLATDGIWLINWGSYPDYHTLVGDFNDDDKDDVCLYRTSLGNWYVAFSTGSAFSTQGVWLENWGVMEGYQSLCADYDGNGKDDVCLYRPANGNWYVATSDGSEFTTRGVWKYSWGTQSTDLGICGKFNLGSAADVGLYRSNGTWYVALSTGSDFNDGATWLTNWGTLSGYQTLTGDFNDDNRTDVCLYRPSNGRWYIAYSTSYEFNPQGIWLYNWGIETGGGSKLVVEISTDDAGQTVPIDPSLSQNYPNPFNPTTTIAYSLPEANQVTLTIYNILGQEVATLLDNQYQEAGNYTIQWNTTDHASGIYFYRLVVGQAVETKKMVLLK